MKPVRRCGTPVTTVDFPQDGKQFLWGGGTPGEECLVCLCEATSGKARIDLTGHRKPVVRARWLKDGTVVSCSFDGHVIRWDDEGNAAASNNVHLSHRSDSFDVSADGAIAVTGDYRGEISGWSLKTGKKAFSFLENPEKRPLSSLAMSPDGSHFVTGGAEGVIRLWDASRRKAANAVVLGRGNHVKGLSWHGDRIAAAVAPDGLAEKGSTSRVAVYDGRTGKELHSLTTEGHQPHCCRFRQDGRLLAAGGGGTDRGGSESKANCVIRVWDVKTGEEAARFSGHTGLVRDLAFSPDQKWLLSAGWDNTVRAWEL